MLTFAVSKPAYSQWIHISDLTDLSATLWFQLFDNKGCNYQFAYDTLAIPDSLLANHSYFSTNDTLPHLEKLQANQHYYLWIRALCDVFDSIIAHWINYEMWTPCEPMSHKELHFIEDFQTFLG